MRPSNWYPHHFGHPPKRAHCAHFGRLIWAPNYTSLGAPHGDALTDKHSMVTLIPIHPHARPHDGQVGWGGVEGMLTFLHIRAGWRRSLTRAQDGDNHSYSPTSHPRYGQVWFSSIPCNYIYIYILKIQPRRFSIGTIDFYDHIFKKSHLCFETSILIKNFCFEVSNSIEMRRTHKNTHTYHFKTCSVWPFGFCHGY